MNPKAYRLPRHILPRYYDVRLEARLGLETFSGGVGIDLDIEESRDSIEIHARDLRITSATLETNGRKLAGQARMDRDREIAVLQFSEPLPVGRGRLDLGFDAQVSRGLEGLYLAQDGPEQVLCTQCEATDARAIFPCFDEPTFKARFAFTITTAADATVLANGPLLSVVESADTASRVWKFAPTKPMSTYLCALVIGDIASTEEQVVDGIPLRVWAMAGKERMGTFAQDYTRRLLPWFEDYFGVPYHFDKYDQVAVPGFSSGAMENSGLVLFRQGLLLMDPQTASWQQQQTIAHVVAHEFAHMWFGNLVTMQWWDDLWLNEAFAEWVAHKAVDSLSPDYEIWGSFQEGKHAALSTDALESTHPIYSPVATPDEATEMFDVITYQKGSAVLRMLESFLGDKPFRAGIRTYMHEFSEQNAVGADLWRHLEQAAREPVGQIMESWVMQSGYPCITLRLEGSGEQAHLSLSQERFYSNPRVRQRGRETWTVPLVIRFEDDSGVHEIRHPLADRQSTLQLPVQGSLRWLYANAGEIGFYRQNLDQQLLAGLQASLHRLGPSEQMGLLGDQWALVRNGTQRIGRFLDLLAPMVAAGNYLVLRQVVNHLHELEHLLEDTGDEQALARFRQWVDQAFSERMSELGFEPGAGESQNTAQQRVAALEAMALLARNAEALRQAQQWQEREQADPASVDPNLAPLFISAAAMFGDRGRFDRYVEIYKRRRDARATPQEQSRYLSSLTSFRDPRLVTRTLQLLDERIIPQQNLVSTLRDMLSRRHAQVEAWGYVQERWMDIRELGGAFTSTLVEATGNLPAGYRDEVVAFFDANLNGVAQKSYARALEAMDQLAEFKARTRDDLIGWFARHGRRVPE